MYVYIYIHTHTHIQIYTYTTKGDKEPRNPAMVTHRQGYMKGDRKRQRETKGDKEPGNGHQGDQGRQEETSSPATRQWSPKKSEQDASEPIGQSLLPPALWFSNLIGLI